MKESISVKPEKTRLINLLEDLSEGSLKIPIFQRDFVWKPDQMFDLFDSITKGYPIGSLLFWKPTESFVTKDKIGPYLINTKNKDVSYVLDGFQRITTLFSVLINPKKFNYEDDDKELKYYLIYYNLKEKEFTYLKSKRESSVYLMPLYKVVDTFEFLDFLREIESVISDKSESNYLIENAKKLSKIFYDYEIPYVEIKGGDIKSAVQIFSRINSTGTDISEDFMLSALSYNNETNFLFSDAITEFLNTLTVYNFNDLKRDTILNCISTSKEKIYFDVKIEDLLKPDLEQLSINAFRHIRKAVEFLYFQLNVLSSRLLPYPTQLIFISEYFRINPFPSDSDLKKLEKWFWVTSYSNYFTIYSLSQQRNAYKYFIEFANGMNRTGIYRLATEHYFDTASFPLKLNYSSVRSKVLQLFYLKRLNLGRIKKNVSLKEQFIFGSKDKAPGNIILRTSSEFESNSDLQDIYQFINSSDPLTLEKYFINHNCIQYFNNNMISSFIKEREENIIKEEETFVNTLDIQYNNSLNELF